MSETSSPTPPGTGTLDDAERMQHKTRTAGRVTDVVNDRGSKSGDQGAPGINMFHSLRGIAPFLGLATLYANGVQAQGKSSESALGTFLVKNKVIFLISFLLDLFLLGALVLVILYVFVKGIAPELLNLVLPGVKSVSTNPA